jgi:hypothetical protein
MIPSRVEDAALALRSFGPSGGRFLAGRNASGGAGLDGAGGFPEAFL